MKNQVDLHLHTLFSDGSLTPEELVVRCRDKGLSHIAVTDHDTTAGVIPAIEHSRDIGGPEVIPAVEFSSHYKGDEIHILAYFIPFDNEIFDDLMMKVRQYNHDRLGKILEIVNKSGYELSLEDIKVSHSQVTCLAPQIINALLDKGQIANLNEGAEFFKSYLIEESSVFVYHENDPNEIVKFCRASGVITSLAHPHKMKNFSNLVDIIDMGVDGIEYFYPNVPDDRKKILDEIADERNLIRTGGSDFHGIFKEIDIGAGNVPVDIVHKMLELKESRK